MKPSNLIDKKFNFLTVISRAHNAKDGQTRWNCICDCGVKCEVSAGTLKSGHTKSCGCFKRTQSGLNRREKLTGLRFGRLVVNSFSCINSSGHCVWNCLCDCGNKTLSITKSLKNGSKKSCGCLHKEKIAQTKRIDISNMVFGKLKAIERVGTIKGLSFFKCLCECGNYKNIAAKDLKNGNTTSCGCKKTKSNFIYILETSSKFNGELVYKIGVDCGGNKRFIKNKRAFNDDLKKIFHINVGEDIVFQIEKEMLSYGYNPKYSGFDGCTEYRALSNGQLEMIKQIALNKEINMLPNSEQVRAYTKAGVK